MTTTAITSPTHTKSRLSRRRITAVMLSHWYTLVHSPLRILELVYWPLLEVVLWGFLTDYLRDRDAKLVGGVTILVGAIVLWDVCFRTQQELAMTQLLGMWDRSQVNMYASPLRASEEVIGSILFSFVRVVIGSLMLCLFARIGFGFNVLSTGALLFPALFALVGFGWAMGLLIRAGILRFGSNAEVLAWSLSALLQPVCAVFYPVSALPGWLQPISQAVPASHVFEAVRSFLSDGSYRWREIGIAFALDAIYIVAAALLLKRSLRAVRERGLLSRPGY
jgi:ABC-2 type transport system permease protein